jgi:hypothetical protein
MLGVTRPSVTIAAGMLQKAGLISYVRGSVEILDRAGLEQAACECYRVITDEFRRLIRPSDQDHGPDQVPRFVEQPERALDRDMGLVERRQS